MSRNASPRPHRSRLFMGAILVVVLFVLVLSFADSPLFSPSQKETPRSADEVAFLEAEGKGEKPESEEEGYERISDEEYARRASESPDQGRIGQRFSAHMNPAQKSLAGGLDWQPLGPRPFTNEYWSGNADASGRVCAILVDPVNPDIVYAAGAQGGVWKTTNAGINWEPMTDGLSSLASGALAFDPTDSDVIYYATGEQHFSGDSFYGDGLFRSEDGALTWTKIAAKTDVGNYISRVAVAPDDNQIIYVGSDLGFLTSADGGATWSVDLGPGYCTDIAIDPVHDGVVYCAFRSSGVWKSTDYGYSWTKLENGLPEDGFRRLNIALAPSDPLVLYAAFATNGGELAGMYKTTDGGVSWTQLTNTPEYLGGQGNYDNCIIVDPNDPDICYAGGTFPFGGAGDHGLIRTTDGGQSWNDINVGIDGSQPHPDHHIFAWGSNGRLWLGNDGGVWYTDDGGQHWTNCNATLALGQIYTNAIHPTDANMILGGTQDNGTARYDGVDAWPQVNAGDGGPSAIEWDSPNIYFTSYVKLSSVYKWDAGSYVGQVAGPWDGERVNWCMAPLVVDQNQPDALLAGTHRVWRTTDSGDSWVPLSDDLTDGGHLRSIAVADGASNTIYTGSSDGMVYVTTDGLNWDLRNDGLPSEEIPDISLDPIDDQAAYLCVDRATGARVFFTDDQGLTWYDYTGDLPEGLRAMCLTVDYRPGIPRLYLGTDYGVYVSIDDGWTWEKADLGLPNLAIFDITVDYTHSRLLAGTHGRGMWTAHLDVVGPEIVLTNPLEGDALMVGSEIDITWTAGDDSGVTGISLFLSRDGGVTFPEALAQDIENSGSFTWQVTGPVSENCRLLVQATDGLTNISSIESVGDFSILTSSAVGGVPSVTALGKAHPNPFNPQTIITFALEKDMRARLQVYTIDGRLVRTLADADFTAGSHQVVWNGEDAQGRKMASGNYLYSLSTSEGFQKTAKMTLMK